MVDCIQDSRAIVLCLKVSSKVSKVITDNSCLPANTNALWCYSHCSHGLHIHVSFQAHVYETKILSEYGDNYEGAVG